MTTKEQWWGFPSMLYSMKHLLQWMTIRSSCKAILATTQVLQRFAFMVTDCGSQPPEKTDHNALTSTGLCTNPLLLTFRLQLLNFGCDHPPPTPLLLTTHNLFPKACRPWEFVLFHWPTNSTAKQVNWTWIRDERNKRGHLLAFGSKSLGWAFMVSQL